MMRLWRVRQFSCVDTEGRVVDIRPKKGIGNSEVAGGRLRCDAPGAPNRSRTFSKSRFTTATEAYEAAADLADQLEAAVRHDLVPDALGQPVFSEAGSGTSEESVVPAGMTLRELGETWIDVVGGAPSTVDQHQRSLNFALTRLPEGIAADEVTSTQAHELLLARRFTVGHRGRKLVRMGRIDDDHDEARMCSVRTEELFLQDLRGIFDFGTRMKPPVVRGNPVAGLKPRKRSEKTSDPSSERTFPPRDILGLAEQVADPVFRALIILRGFTAIRTGECAAVTVTNVDREACEIVLRGTAGETPKRLSTSQLPWDERHLKHRQPDDVRCVPYPNTPLFIDLIDELIDEATRRAQQRELRAHRRVGPRLLTMADGAPLKVSRFDRDVWKPALRSYYPEADPQAEGYNPLRETRFYNLRSAAIEFLIEEAHMDESAVAELAGHSVETQRRSNRRSRKRPHREGLDQAASQFSP